MSDESLDHGLAQEVLTLVHRILRSLALYEPNNAAVVSGVDALENHLGQHAAGGGGELKLQLLAEEAFVNGRLLKVDAAGYERAADLAKTLAKWNVGELRFAEGAGRADVEAFVEACSTALREGANSLSGTSFGKISVGPSRGQSMASFRFQPDRLAIWLYGSLLDLTDKLYLEVKEGKTPSLLPLRRLLQMVIDSQRSSGGIFQLLTAVRDCRKPLPHTHKHAAMAVDAAGFGLYIGLGNADVMTLALAALLSGLARSKDPEEAVRPLFGFGGLGVLAMPLILASADVQKATAGQKSGIPGLIVATVGGYHSLAGTPKSGLSPAKALEAMAAGKVRGIQGPMATLFRGYKGKWPLGSPLKLADGRVGIVVNLGEELATAERPKIRLMKRDGTLGKELDLLQHPNVDIEAALNPAKMKLDLSAL